MKVEPRRRAWQQEREAKERAARGYLRAMLKKLNDVERALAVADDRARKYALQGDLFRTRKAVAQARQQLSDLRPGRFEKAQLAKQARIKERNRNTGDNTAIISGFVQGGSPK